jgi:hypothetical protein
VSNLIPSSNLTAATESQRPWRSIAADEEDESGGEQGGVQRA